MANWFEMLAGTMTEAEARAYFRASNYPKPYKPGEIWGDAIAALMKQPGDCRWDVDHAPRVLPPVAFSRRLQNALPSGRQASCALRAPFSNLEAPGAAAHVSGPRRGFGRKRCFQVAFGTPM